MLTSLDTDSLKQKYKVRRQADTLRRDEPINKWVGWFMVGCLMLITVYLGFSFISFILLIFYPYIQDIYIYIYIYILEYQV